MVFFDVSGTPIEINFSYRIKKRKVMQCTPVILNSSEKEMVV